MYILFLCLFYILCALGGSNNMSLHIKSVQSSQVVYCIDQHFHSNTLTSTLLSNIARIANAVQATI